MNRWLICVLNLGDQLSLADIHLAVWLARIAHLSGALPSEDGNSVIEKIEGLVGTKFAKDISIVEARRRAGLDSAVKLPGAGADEKANGAVSQTIQPSTDKGSRQSRLAAFWETIKERPSWKKVYEAGLH
jgi:glutathione S-transferase